MAAAQVSSGYSPPIGQPWGSLPILSTINEISDLVDNPNPSTSHDVTGILGTALPGPAGLGVSALSSALPGGWLDQVLGLGDFSQTITAPSAVGTEGPLAGMYYSPGLKGLAPGTGFWGAVQEAVNSAGGGIGDALTSIGNFLGLNGPSASLSNPGDPGSSGDTGAGTGLSQKFGGGG